MAIVALFLAAVIIAVDQGLKLWAVQCLKTGGTKVFAGGLLKFTYTENRGAAFSIFQNQRWLFVAITAVVCVIIIAALFMYGNHGFFSYAASILILGGGLGNLIDRVVNGYVVDYIYVSFFPAIFNFSDCCVTVGAIFLIIHVLLFSERNNNSEKVIRTRR